MRNLLPGLPPAIQFLSSPVPQKNRMRKICCLLCILPALANAQWNTRIKTADSVLSYLYERQLFNGTVLVAEKGKILYKKAFGIAAASGTPLTTASAFNLASVSKQFFAMMAMMLKEEGKLKYDDAVQRYLPSFPYASITVRHLLNQTSGLPEYFDIVDQYRTLLDTLTNESMLALLASKKPALLFTPGAQWQYCNTNYTTLASVIEKIAGISCAQFLEKRIAAPLGLKNTFIYQLTMKTYPPSRVFGFHYAKGKPVSDDLVWLDGIVGDGNVYSSVEDLYRWDRALYTEKLVKKTTWEEAITPAVLPDGTAANYGFGWFIHQTTHEVDHTGGWVAFGTYIDRFIKDDKTFILLGNSASNYARNIVKDILTGKPFSLPATLLISNVQLIDGTGTAMYRGSLRIVNDRIHDMGNLTAFINEPVVDGKGYVLAPGFIDSHSHHEGGLQDDPSGTAAINQGITTIVIGQDGASYPVDTLKERIRKNPVSINIATYTGHASLRESVMKGSLLRSASADETTAMQTLLAEDISKGSLGLSTGLEYEEGFYATREEVIKLAQTTATAGGRYISHIRSEDVNIETALDEIIQIGREAKLPVQISHIKIALRSKWGSAADILATLQRARAEGINITADCYPYTMWSSTPRVLFPKKDFDNAASALYATQELFDPASSVLTYFPANKKYEGNTITQVAAMHHETAAQALMRVVREAGGQGSAIAGASMQDADVIKFLQWNNTVLCSDGANGGHPRGYGAFTRFLGNYVREKKIMSLESAVYKMTGLSAEHLGLQYRGLLSPGYFADLVLFDPATVADKSTMTDSKALSEGIAMVWVNGQLVYQNQQPLKVYPGKLILRPGARQ
jgi:N-acyl-D-amino-acid deacylase